MKFILSFVCGLAASLLSLHAQAQTSIFVSMHINDVFQNTLSNSVIEAATKHPGTSVTVAFSDENPQRQIQQIKEAIDRKASVLVVNIPNDEVAAAADKMAAEAGIPLVFINAQPSLPKFHSRSVIVTSNDLVAGRLQARLIGKLLSANGKVGLVMGPNDHPAAKGRTAGVREVFKAMPDIEIIAEGTAGWKRAEAKALVAKWLREGKEFDAIIANNDEMALGAAEAFSDARIPPSSIFIAGVDATPVALEAMDKKILSLTVLQNAKEQGRVSLEDAMKLVKGEYVPQYDWVPYELVLPTNLSRYAKK